MGAYILVVEDEEKLARFTELELKHEGYQVDKVGDGRSALEMALEKNYDLILLDIMLPELNGLEVLRRLHREELLARIRVALKLHGNSAATGMGAGQTSPADAGVEDKNGKIADGVYKWNSLLLDVPKHSVTYDGHSIELTNREFVMLQVLLENMDIVLSRDTLLERVCGYDYLGETNVIDVYVRYLRTKIDEVYDVKMIQTVRGVGYVIKG